ncbi:MAG: tetratricopeptide repeat protein [Bacteroidota bacterium]
MKVIPTAKNDNCLAVEGKAYNHWGVLLQEQGNYQEAVKKLSMALDIRSKLGDSVGVASVLNNLTFSELGQGNQEKAIRYCIKAITILEKKGITENLGHNYLSLSGIYEKNMDKDEAIKYNQKALAIFKEQKDLQNEGNAQYQLANIYFVFKDFLKASLEFEATQRIFEQVNDIIGIGMCLDALGAIATETGDFEQAIAYLEEANKVYISANDTLGLLYNHLNISELLYKKKAYQNSLSHCLIAQSYLKRFGGLREEMLVTEFLGNNYTALEDFENAFSYKEKELALRDSLFNIEKAKEIVDIQTKYDTEKLKRQNAEQALENKERTFQRNSLIGISILLLTGILGAITYFRKRQKALRIINSQQKELHKSEIDEILNDQEIKFIAARLEGREQERENFYEELHHNISNQLVTVKWKVQDVLENLGDNPLLPTLSAASNMLNRTYNEIRALLEQFRSGNVDKIGIKSALADFCQTINNTDRIKVTFSSFGDFTDINSQQELWVYRVSQELIGNALKYSEAKEIDVSLNRHPELITLIVSDDGAGFDKNQPTKGTGLKSMHRKIEDMNGTFKIDSGANIGTTVFVTVPAKMSEKI